MQGADTLSKSAPRRLVAVPVRARPVSSRGADITYILGTLQELGVEADAVSLDLKDLVLIEQPCILHWRFDHFVVLVERRNRGAVINDPARGQRFVSEEELSRSVTGVAVIVADSTKVAKVTKRIGASKAWSLFPTNRYSLSAIALMLVLTGAYQIAALGVPLALMHAVNAVSSGASTSLLATAAIAIAALMLYQTAISGRRFNEQAQQASGPSIDLHCGFVPVALSRSIVERGGDLIAARLG